MGSRLDPAGSELLRPPCQHGHLPASLEWTRTLRAVPGVGHLAVQAPGNSALRAADPGASPHSQCAAAGISCGTEGGQSEQKACGRSLQGQLSEILVLVFALPSVSCRGLYKIYSLLSLAASPV